MHTHTPLLGMVHSLAHEPQIPFDAEYTHQCFLPLKEHWASLAPALHNHPASRQHGITQSQDLPSLDTRTSSRQLTRKALLQLLAHDRIGQRLLALHLFVLEQFDSAI
jgi:hypothetical protein